MSDSVHLRDTISSSQSMGGIQCLVLKALKGHSVWLSKHWRDTMSGFKALEGHSV